MSLSTILVAALLADPEAALTYSKDIAPIFQKSCQGCHRPGEVAPMSLLTYKDVRPWARSIKKYVKSGEMPPWHADPEHGKFKNDPRLTKEAIDKISSWVDAGAPEGDPKDHPEPREFVDGWRIGKPDVVFTMPLEFHVRAEGEIPYKYFVIETNFKEDRWVQAAEARPGNRSVVHHIIAFLREPGRRRGRGIWNNHLCGMAPGEEPDAFAPGTGKLIKAGSKIILQMHYTPNGKATTDRSSVGLIFAKEPVRQVHTRAAMNMWFRIPPGNANHEVRSTYDFRRPAKLLGVMPHMHLRGKSFRYDIQYPDGKSEILLSVPRWDFNWQHQYTFAQPLSVPAGTRLKCTAIFDNSKNNLANPDPTKTVRWGDQSWEEMMIGFLWYVEDDGKPLPGEKTASLKGSDR